MVVTAPTLSREQQLLTDMLQASFEARPFEDGMDHPAEEIIGDTLRSSKSRQSLGWLRAICTDASQPAFAASVLRCLGRHNNAGSVAWRVGLVRNGLAINNVEIRDAAIQAAESWADSEMIEVLTNHSEPEPWLQQYLSGVIDDIVG